ncbi:MAG TPA: hypothetical protein VG820_04640, partial [Fimbriimonadaceae bacterium]|nr:hypothetical protein [Fimbriimonadaceae bacterium]
MRRAVLALIPLLAATCYAQDRLPHMPRYDRYEKLRREIFGSVVRGELNVRWADDSHSFTFLQDGKRLRYDLKTSMEAEDTSSADAGPTPQGRGRRGGGQRGMPARG